VKERVLKLLTKYGPYVGFPLFYVACLLVFSVLLFPYDKLKERLVASYNAQQKGPNAQQLEIDELHGSWLTGVRASGVRLLSPSTEPGKPPTKIEIDDATVRYSLLSGMVGTTWVSFDLFGMGGEISGHFESNGKANGIDATLDSIELGDAEPVGALLGIPIKGKLGGDIHLEMPEGKASKANGAISLEVKDMTVGDGKAKIKGMLALPKVDVGPLTFAAEAKDGVLKISKLLAGGKDVEVQGEGRVTMRDVSAESICDAQVRFKINDSYRTRSEITKTLFGAPGSSIPPAFEMADPRIRTSKRADGFYGWSVRGVLARLDFAPAPGGGGGPGAPGGNLFGVGPKVGP
jgi:type II secretion system protein N